MTDLNVDICPKVEEELDTVDPPGLGRHHQGSGPVLRPEVDMTHDPEGGKITTIIQCEKFGVISYHF